MPIIIHEIVHQLGFGEREANAYQAMADVIFKYKPIYASSVLAFIACGHLVYKKHGAELKQLGHDGLMLNLGSDLQNGLYCAANTATVADALERAYTGKNGLIIPSGLSPAHTDLLIWYGISKKSDAGFTFWSLIRTLREPSGMGSILSPDVESGWILALAAKAAMTFIQDQVALEQNQIELDPK